MNTQRIALSLALLASTPYAVSRAAEIVQQESTNRVEISKRNLAAIIEIEDLIMTNQDVIKGTLRAILRLDEEDSTAKVIRELSAEDTLTGLEIILANQNEIISMVQDILRNEKDQQTKDIVKLSEGEELRGILLILANQHTIIALLRQVLNINVDTRSKEIEELSIQDEVFGLQTVVTNQHEILAMAQRVLTAQRT